MASVAEPIPVDTPYEPLVEVEEGLEVLPYERPIESSDETKSACPLLGLFADTLDF